MDHAGNAEGRGRLMLLTTDDGQRPGGGRELLSRLLHAVLGELFADVHTVRLTGAGTAAGALRGRLNGLDGARLDAIAGQAAWLAPDRVLIDGSNLGAAAAAIKARCPDLPVTTFFHNCETRFFADALRAAPSLRGLGVLAGHWQAERLALRHSDQCITLCERDGAELARRFGRGQDAVAAMALDDRRDPACAPVQRAQPYALFVGGGFFGNVEGLRWYARHVAPQLSVSTLVVGRGLDGLAGALPANMELVGPVDDLSPWYAGAALVVAPILSGSGMKTKVAEALMHGKRVVGTAEAFAGYGDAVLAANLRCDDPADFAAAVARLAANPAPPFDPALRELYARFHSRAALRATLAQVLG